ncbi:DNA-packaging protein [Candidatus Paracaedibacter symbiosus]|uniref:DNA-packaging protein n=1 Tax=Candidatus Paracaedibacter symbiosus TaxID=244582 RepID=UPI000AFDAC5E|nr:terminase family protein [Candidatus Paracaedibacter symbiosus]
MTKQRLIQLLIHEKRERLLLQQKYNWLRQARPSQLPPEGDWRTWLILAGRGFGKTRTGAETIRHWVHQGRYKRIALVGASIQEVQKVMVEGESGLLAVHPKSEAPTFYASKRRLVWPNGAVALLYGAEYYEQLRGPQFDFAWIDEFAKFRNAEQLWHQLQLCLRLGANPRCLITTTPRPTPILRQLLASSDVCLTKGSTFDNEANLAPAYIEQIKKQFLETTLGAQELYAEMLTEEAGALWGRTTIRYQEPPLTEAQDLKLERIVIAIDPATTHHQDSDETGIVVAGIDQEKKVYILEDLSGKYSPNDWGQRVAEAYWRHKADRVVAEVNKGGDLVEQVVRSVDAAISYKSVRATRGKYTRAEPIAALYEQGRVFHARPFSKLETQMCSFIPGQSSKSPDRMDAMVWAVTELLLQNEATPVLKVWSAL